MIAICPLSLDQLERKVCRRCFPAKPRTWLPISTKHVILLDSPFPGCQLSALHSRLSICRKAGCQSRMRPGTISFGIAHPRWVNSLTSMPPWRKQLSKPCRKPLGGEQKRVISGVPAKSIEAGLRWLNEIFADIYGTLIAGPAIGWSMQRLLRSRLNRRDLFHIHEDPDHPDPYIRPFVHSVTLRRMAELTKAGEFAEQLRVVCG